MTEDELRALYESHGRTSPWFVDRATYDEIVASIPPHYRFSKNDGTENILTFGAVLMVESSDEDPLGR